MRLLKISNNKTVILDDDYFERLSIHKWTFHPNGYAYRNIFVNGKIHKLYMHREIMGDMAGLYIDHINHNGLDNRKENLRFATSSQNHANCRKSEGKSSRYKGVCFDKSRNKWVTHIHVNGKQKHLGRFDDEDEAALAYNNAASFYFGEYANLNIIGACKQ